MKKPIEKNQWNKELALWKGSWNWKISTETGKDKKRGGKWPRSGMKEGITKALQLSKG